MSIFENLWSALGGTGVVACFAAVISASTFWFTTRKESTTLAVAESNMRLSLVKEMTEASAGVVAESRRYMALALKNPPEVVKDYRDARNEFVVRSAAVTVQLRAYLSETDPTCQEVNAEWRRLRWVLEQYNLLCEKREHYRTQRVIDYLESKELPDWMLSDWQEDFKGADNTKFSYAFFMTGEALMEQVYPLAKRVVEAPRSRVFSISMQPRLFGGTKRQKR